MAPPIPVRTPKTSARASEPGLAAASAGSVVR